MAAGAPAGPAASTPTKANCDPPLKRSRDSAWVWRRSRPAATDRAPKLTPYAPVATATDIDWRSTARRRAGASTTVTMRRSRCGGRPVGRRLGADVGDQPHLARGVTGGGDDAVAERTVGVQ